MATTRPNPFAEILQAQGVAILDGGLATELEARGHDLADDLWSARLLLDAPEALRDVHLTYLEAGADCIASASYQASFEGLARRGLTVGRATEVLRSSVTIARGARDHFWARMDNRAGRRKPLVAASIGPYGAVLADGSEYRGDYRLDEAELESFHRERWQILAASGADLLACETVPSRTEVRVLSRLLASTTGAVAWLGLSCHDARHLSDGSPLAEVASDLQGCPGLLAVGVNCLPPEWVADAIVEIRRGWHGAVVVYPNSGERWNADTRRWSAEASGLDLAVAAAEWRTLGARLIGGCCRVGPRQIERLRAALLAPAGTGPS